MMHAVEALAFGALLVCCGCGRSNVEKGETSIRLGDYERAMVFFSRELDRRPDCGPARAGLGRALLQKAVDKPLVAGLWEEALRNLESAHLLDPSQETAALLCEAWTEKARLCLKTADTVEALSALSRALEHNPRKTEAMNLAGIIYFRLGETAKSEMLFLKAIAIDSSDASARFNLGMVHWNAGAVDKAHRQWLAALSLAPDDEDILYWFAVAEKKARETP